MKCPLGYTDHPATWRCYVIFAANWLAGRWPKSWPYWTYRPLLWIVLMVDVPAKPKEYD